MADAPVFTFVCGELERATSLTALEARGTVRLALKAAGLDARAATAEQVRVVLERVLPGELQARGCESAPRVCSEIAARLEALRFEPSAADSPEAVFARLGARGARA